MRLLGYRDTRDKDKRFNGVCPFNLFNLSRFTLELEYQPEDLVLYAFYASRKHVAKKVPIFISHLQQHANSVKSSED